MNKTYTVFGFKTVESGVKKGLVYNIFQDVNQKYDLMNDLMCFGLHRMWKNQVLKEIYPLENKIILDVAGGTGDISRIIRNKNSKNKIFICDINKHMLKSGIDKFVDKNIDIRDIYWICGDAEKLPIKDNCIDFYVVAFGMRNFSNIDVALQEAYRVLKPGGKFICLEFSTIDSFLLNTLYKQYLDKVIPKIGKIVAKNEEAYQYLADSIQTFPNQEDFAKIIKDANFIKINFKNLTKGIVSIHTAFKSI